MGRSLPASKSAHCWALMELVLRASRTQRERSLTVLDPGGPLQQQDAPAHPASSRAPGLAKWTLLFLKD